MNRLVVFTLDDQAYALRLATVEHVARMVSVTPLPKAPEIVMGIVNVRGRIVPVFDIRRRFRLPAREIAVSDQLVIARTSRRAAALVADAVAGVRAYPEEVVVEAKSVLPGVEYVEGVVKLADGLILIHDLDKFLSLEEGESLDRALPAA
ncbi:MAG: chemotaxis protein CheW [Pseudomonadota bacterium]